MDVSLSDAKARLTELVRKAEAGEEVVLTRHGRPAARIVPVDARPLAEVRRELFGQLRESVRAKAGPGPDAGPDAEHAADFLYDENGLPG